MSISDDIAASNKRQSDFYQARENEPWTCGGDDDENKCGWCDEAIEPQHTRTVYDGEPHHIDCAALAMDNEYSH